ncbi:hypothetical protein BGW80DRAFT_799193 [Lactifluus volemus]|nr:hypothetical protein BGW80DRAFT_799193 [Lactifluus volemus]
MMAMMRLWHICVDPFRARGKGTKVIDKVFEWTRFLVGAKWADDVFKARRRGRPTFPLTRLCRCCRESIMRKPRGESYFSKHELEPRMRALHQSRLTEKTPWRAASPEPAPIIPRGPNDPSLKPTSTPDRWHPTLMSATVNMERTVVVPRKLYLPESGSSNPVRYQ